MEKLTLSKKVVEEDLIKNAKPIFNPFQKKIQLNKSNDKEREFNANTMQNNLYDTLSETTAKVEEEDQEEAEEELEIQYQQDPIDIGFNVTYLIDVLTNIQDEKVNLAFLDTNSSCLFTIPNNNDYKYVVMPMRI